MASPTESKVDENEVTSEPHHHRRNRDGRGQGGDEQEVNMGYPLARQSSIYSLTLDEIQNTVCEPGKTFGSMNMDEFLNNIWSVEEGFAAANNNVSADSASAAPANAPSGTTGGGGGADGRGAGGASGSAANGGALLHRQGSLAIPPPLCRKTVDEVWAEIHGQQGVRHDAGGRAHRGGGNAENADRQQTFGEMTLEDFLIKAGVVREGFGPALPHPPVTVAAASMQQSYEMPTSYPLGSGAEGAGFVHVVGPSMYEYRPPPPPPHHHQHHPAVSEGHGKRYGNGYGMQQVRLGSPVSPVSSDGIGGSQVENSGYHGNGGGVGIEVNGALKMNGRKRGADGGAEKVVERRQRRMIKNRESAARSRARKQAYTVELEAELNLLKEENARLKEEEKRAQAGRKQLILECMAEHSRANMEKAERSLRRCNSGPL